MRILLLCEDSIFSYPIFMELISKDIKVEACVCADLKKTGSVIESLCKKFNISLYNNETIYQILREGELERVDIGFSYGYKKRILEELYNFPLKGIINFHPAPLPEFKGKATYVHGYLKHVSEWGVVAHYVDKDFDTGPIIKKRMFPIDYDNIYHGLDLSETAREQLFILFKEVLDELLTTGFVEQETIEPKEANYYSQKDLDNLKEIKADDPTVDKKIKALWGPPYEGAYIYIGDKKYYLIDKDILQEFYILWLKKKEEEIKRLFD